MRVLNVDSGKSRISMGMASGEAGDDREEVTSSSRSSSSSSGPAPNLGAQSGFGSMADFFKNAKRVK